MRPIRCIALRAVDLDPAPNRHRATQTATARYRPNAGGGFDDARMAFVEACRLAGDTSISALCLSYLAFIDLWEGNEDEALAGGDGRPSPASYSCAAWH